MATNEFKPFAIGAGANVIDQADYEALAELSSGFTAGKASSEQVNKVLRQASSIASLLAQYIADKSGNDVLDDGDSITQRANLEIALKVAIQKIISDENISVVGIPQPWPTSIAPVGWLKCNGSTFNMTLYPGLAMAYPNGVLPDLRGEFIRGLDDGRGVDVNRALLSEQGDAIRNITGVQSLVVAYNGESTGVFYNNGKNANEGIYSDGSPIIDAPPLGNASGSSEGEKIYFDTSRVVPTAVENRPRNIAFNYIVRAA